MCVHVYVVYEDTNLYVDIGTYCCFYYVASGTYCGGSEFKYPGSVPKS